MMYKDRSFLIKSSGQRLFFRLIFFFLVYCVLNFNLVQSHDNPSSGKCKKIFAADLRSNAGHRLTNSTMNIKVHALSQIHCMFQCNQEPCCRSTNFRKGDSSDGKENCELLHALASEQPKDLKQDKDYDYCILLEPERLLNCSCLLCKNNGRCETSKKLCSCDSGFAGKQCEKDIDECISNPCHQNSTCNNTVGSFTHNQGFTGNGTNCTDVDECGKSNSCHKNSTCNNTVGSYICTCNQGFTGNGTNCTDVNECSLGLNICHQNSTCNNTVGSFTCTCNQGFTGNGTNCTDVNECSFGLNICHQNSTCNNTIGSFTCTCNQGFSGNGDNCTDVDECNSKLCHQNSTCNNTVGSYTCTCNQGFTGNGTNCTDVDECGKSNYCHKNSTCNNTVGSYICTCNQGFTGNGTNCTDVNECHLGSNICHQNSTCNNTVGSFTCTCNQGFTGNGDNCTDVDECNSNICHQNSSCKNTVGSYTCTCNQGFIGNGINCTVPSCADLYKNGVKENGVYIIDPDGKGAFNVSCDMTTDGGGWTVFQRRMDGSVDFYRNWTDYKNGFGNLSGEFWLGLDKINRLTESGQDVLRVDLEDFENQERFAQYNTFALADESAQYKLTVGGYSGNATDSLTYHNGMKFSTKDNDNDKYSGANCAVDFKGAWWYKHCHYSNLNGLYLRGNNTKLGQGVIWHHWKEDYYSLKKSEMKVRPRHF